jgi:hypothetical protein
MVIENQADKVRVNATVDSTALWNSNDNNLEATRNLQNDVNDLRGSSLTNSTDAQSKQKSNDLLQSKGLLPGCDIMPVSDSSQYTYSTTNDSASAQAKDSLQTNSTSNTDAARQQSDSLQAGSTENNSTANADQQEWTVAVDLTTTLNNGEFGAEKKQEQLRQLAEQSKDSNVTLDVQYRVPDSDAEGAGGTLKHYQIKDGQIIEQADTRSKGMAKDLEDLVSTASHDDPSKKIGLIVQSHGTPQDGIRDGMGDSANLDQLDEAISNGLKGSGHDKLDMLDLDSCLTASTATLNKAKNVADNLVASAQTETAGPNSDGQNLNAALSDLFNNPTVDGSQLSDEFVTEAKNDANGKGTETLAHFDLSKADQLDNSLDNLGNTLTELAKDPSNRAVLQRDIENAVRYAPGNDQNETSGLENRDLKQVLNNIKASLDSGELNDTTGKLSQAVEQAMSAENAVTVSNYTGKSKKPASNLDPATTGDLSIFAPGQNFNDVHATADRGNLLNKLGDISSDDTSSQITSMDQASMVRKQLDQDYADITKSSVGSADLDAVKNALGQDITKLDSATTLDEYKQAAQKLNSDVTGLKGTKIYQDFEALARQKAQQKKDRDYQNAQNEEAPGWNNFINSMDV